MLLMLLISMLGLGAKRTYGSTLFRGLKLQKIPGNLAQVTPRKQPPLDPEDTPNAHAQRPVAKKNTSGEHRIHTANQAARSPTMADQVRNHPPHIHPQSRRKSERRRHGETEKRTNERTMPCHQIRTDGPSPPRPRPRPPPVTAVCPSQPQTIPHGTHRETGGRPTQVGHGVHRFPRLHRRLHEPPARQHKGIHQRTNDRRTRRGSHPV